MNRKVIATLAWLGLAASSFAACAQSQEGGGESLIDPAQYRGLAADHRAYRVGDVVTVLVIEATRAKSQAATDAASDLDMHVGLTSPSTRYDATLGVGGSNSGGAQTTRVGELSTQISTQVI